MALPLLLCILSILCAGPSLGSGAALPDFSVEAEKLNAGPYPVFRVCRLALLPLALAAMSFLAIAVAVASAFIWAPAAAMMAGLRGASG